LSGTPIENTVDDLIGLFQFVAPGTLHPGDALPIVHNRIKRHFLRRLKKDVLGELPPIIEQTIRLRLEGIQAETYDGLWANRQALVLDEEGENQQLGLLSVITKLKQVCNYEPVSDTSVKLEALLDMLSSSSGESDKVVVFSQYVRTITWLQERLPGASVSVLHGGMSAQERDAAVKTFEENPGPRVILISLRAGGVGLNLNSASLVVLFDRWWNPAVEQQAIARAHRFGKDRPLQVVRFLIEDTVEERIDQIIDNKLQLVEASLDSVATIEVGRLTIEDLRSILKLPYPAP
jgi:SNF2 family DNA or RNA helicase